MKTSSGHSKRTLQFFALFLNVTIVCGTAAQAGDIPPAAPKTSALNKAPSKLDLKPQWRPLETNLNKKIIEGKESIITLNGVTYKSLEVEGKHFLLEMKAAAQTADEDDLNCTMSNRRVDDTSLVTVSTKSVTLPSFYIEGLKKKCILDDSGRMHSKVEQDLRIGVNITKDKKKKIWWAPYMNMFGVSSDF